MQKKETFLIEFNFKFTINILRLIIELCLFKNSLICNNLHHSKNVINQTLFHNDEMFLKLILNFRAFPTRNLTSLTFPHLKKLISLFQSSARWPNS